jgi:UPF0755 protein
VSDDLGLGLRDDHGPQEPPHYGRRRLAIGAVLLAVVALIVIGAVVVGRFATDLLGAPADYSGRGDGSVVIQIHQGDSVTAIGQTLKSHDVVRSVGAFTDAAGSNARASTIGPGFYRLRLHMKASLALALLLDPASLVQSRIVIPEGFTMRAILARIAADSNIPLADLQQAAKSPASLGVPSWGAGHPLEGFLYPATYTFDPNTTARQALTAMVHRFAQEMTTLDFATRAQHRGYTPYQLLTLASIVQREGRIASDFPKIAEVFYNRLRRGMKLESDATLYYVLPPDHGPLTGADLKIDSPYNTRMHTGLTPTPINSPGELALRSVLDPAVGPYLYFVTIDKAGHAAFATTLDEFNRLVAESRRNGVR